MATKSEKHLHGPCASMLMKEFGVPHKWGDEVIRLIAEIYHYSRMAHCLIINSIRSDQPSRATIFLERFLQDNGTQDPKKYLAEMARKQEEEF